MCAKLEMPAMALLDRDGVYGAPRFHLAAKKISLRAHIGAEVTSADGWRYPLLVESRAGYQNFCRLITHMKLRARKGEGSRLCRGSCGKIRWPYLSYGRRRRTAGACARPWRNRRAEWNASSNSATFLAATMSMSNCSGISAARKKRAIRPRWRLRANCVCPCSPPMASATRRLRQREVLDVFTCIRHHRTLATAGRLLRAQFRAPFEISRGNVAAVCRSSRSHCQHAKSFLRACNSR